MYNSAPSIRKGARLRTQAFKVVNEYFYESQLGQKVWVGAKWSEPYKLTLNIHDVTATTRLKAKRHKSKHKESLRESVTRFFASGFFHESVSPKPLSIPLGPFRIFSKIRGIIRSSRLTSGINDTGGKFATGVNDAGGKIAAGINDTGGKFAAGINNTSLPPVSLVLLIPVANLPPVSTIPAV
jgi:hypothetical protein